MAPDDRRRLRAVLDLVLWTLILAVIAGLIEGFGLGIADAAGFITWVGEHQVWQAPAASAVMFGLVALPLAVLAGIMPRAWRWLMLVPASMAVLGLVFLVVHYKLAVWAQVALSLGIGYRLAGFIDGRRNGWRRSGLKALGVLSAIVVASGIVVANRTNSDTRQAVAAGAAPNVLIVVLDAVRASSLGVYGYPRPTSPALDRLAASGVVFERAYATAPWTLPSHGSMFSGRWPRELQIGWRRGVPDSIPLLAEFARSKSYRTGGFTGNLLYTTTSSGFSRGFMRYESFPHSAKQFLLAPALVQLAWQRRIHFRSQRRLSDRKSAAAVARGFLDWVGTDTTPFFSFLNLYDAHAPYDPPPGWRERFRSGNTRIDAYDASIAAQDSVFGALLDSLDARRLLNRTIVLVTADHGELHGEHGIRGHGNSLYLPELHVPLVVAGPGIPAEFRVRSTVSLRDIAATVVQLLNVNETPFPGESLVRHWREPGTALPTSPAYSEIEPAPGVEPGSPLAGGPLRSLVAGSYRAVEHANGRLELFNIEADPGEERDLANDAVHADTIAEMRRRLHAIRRWP